jgi:hypothetical protein
VQRHLLFPSLATLQVELGQSLQSLDELQLGSCGVAQLIHTSASTIMLLEEVIVRVLSLNGNDKLSGRIPSKFVSYLT